MKCHKNELAHKSHFCKRTSGKANSNWLVFKLFEFALLIISTLNSYYQFIVREFDFIYFWGM
jgi:hypothetical protein